VSASEVVWPVCPSQRAQHAQAPFPSVHLPPHTLPASSSDAPMPARQGQIFQWYFTEVVTFRYYETNFLNFKRALKHNSYKLITLTLSPQGAYLCGYVLPFSIQLIQANTFGQTISADALFSYRGTHVFKEKNCKKNTHNKF